MDGGRVDGEGVAGGARATFYNLGNPVYSSVNGRIMTRKFTVIICEDNPRKVL